MRIRIAIAVALLIVAAGCKSATAPDATSDASASEETEARTVTPDDGLETVEEWFAAYDEGDIAAMLDLFASDAELWPGDAEEPDLQRWELLYEWKVAQGTDVLPHGCAAEEIPGRDAVAVECEYAVHEYASQAVDGPAVPYTMTLEIGPAGIAVFDDDFGPPAFNVYGEPMAAWLQAHHPEETSALAFDWQTVDEARAAGAAVARYADEWAAWLEDNPSCTWRDTNCQGADAQGASERPSP